MSGFTCAGCMKEVPGSWVCPGLAFCYHNGAEIDPRDTKIEALEAENKRLREALNPDILWEAARVIEERSTGVLDEMLVKSLEKACDKARAALSPGTGAPATTEEEGK